MAMSRWKRWPVISVILGVLLVGAAMWAFSGRRDSPSNGTESNEGQFKPPTLNSGLPYPPADLVIVQEIRADLTGDGNLERVIVGYHQIDNDGTDAYLCICRKAVAGRNEQGYHEVYRDYIGNDADDVRLEFPPEYYYRELEAHRDREESRGKATDIRVSGRGLMVVASGRGWEAYTHGLNVEMVVWDVAKSQFKRIFAIGARQDFPLIEHVHLLDVDVDYESEVVVFSATGHWNDPKAQHVCRVYKWNPKHKAYRVVSPDQPLKTQGTSGWIRK
jgi:hypothetical protein